MNFNSIHFIFIFLPVCLSVFYAVPPRLRLPTLLIFSMIFYTASGIGPGILLFTSIVVGFLGAHLCRSGRPTSHLLVALSFPLAALFVSKYLGFSLRTFGINLETDGVIDLIAKLSLPAGISFYTFQLVSYLVDLRDGKIEREVDFFQFGTYIAFFPQLIAGPILRYSELQLQLKRIATEHRLNPDLHLGIKYCTFGFAYKIFFSDILTTIHIRYNNIEGAASIDALYSVLSYSTIIYFDFWSYSLIAIGLAKLFAINLPRNFREPYKSLSPRDFWKRWHITLSFWLRDYVYFRIGGRQNYTRNIIILFGLVGLWHGAGWNFVLWGFYHAFWVLVYNACKKWWDPLPTVIQVVITYTIVSLGWPLFYLDISGYIQLYSNLFLLGGGVGNSIYGAIDWVYLGIILGWIFLVKEDYLIFNKRSLIFDHPVFLASLFVGSVLFLSYGRTFIYFQF